VLTLVSEARGRPAGIARRRGQIALAAGMDDQFRDVLAATAADELAMTQLSESQLAQLALFSSQAARTQ
jgi:hypothetical protein